MQLKDDREFILPNEMRLLIYGDHKKFQHPENCVITDAEGHIKFVVEAPQFKSDKMIDGVKNEMYSTPERIVWVIPPHKKKVKNFWGKVTGELPEQGYIDKYTGMTRVDDMDCAEMIISDGAEYFEIQYLNIQTGEFLDIAKWGGRF